MTYQIRIETASGAVKKVDLWSKGSVLDFIRNYPNHLPVGTRVKLECDLLGISGYASGVRQ